MIESAYPIIETNTKIILFFAPSRLTAMSLTHGMLNTKAVEFPIHPEFGVNSLDDIDNESEIIQLVSSGRKIICRKLSENSVLDDVYKKRKLLKLRSKYLYMLELWCVSQITRTATFFDNSLIPFVDKQLLESDPMVDFYTSPIQEYASVCQISNETAYQELAMKNETAGLIKLRVQALYDKYSLLLTNLSDQNDFEQVMTEIGRELYLNSYV